MPPRIVSPFKPARPAVIEPIDQPLYASALLAATIAAQNTYFNVGFGTPGQNKVFTNLDGNGGQLPSPKIFVILGIRFHVAQDIAFVQADGAAWRDLAIIGENTFSNLFIGTKDYFTCPTFYLSSGLGVWLSGAAEDSQATNFLATAQMGMPIHHSYKSVNRHPITIPPQQNFNMTLNVGGGLTPVLSANRRTWMILEGDFGREVQ
jgi:hypothetical protein